MILYVSSCYSFQEFSYLILEKLRESGEDSGSANIIIADHNIYEHYYLDGTESTATVNYINSLGYINVTLVESLSELINVLGEHFLDKEREERSDLPSINKNTKIIGLYGVFDQFLKQGTKLMTKSLKIQGDNVYRAQEEANDTFMDKKDYSAKTVNYICNIMYNLEFYKKYRIYMNDPYENTNIMGKTYKSIIWNERIPNLQPDKELEVDIGIDYLPQEANNTEEDSEIIGETKGSDTNWVRPEPISTTDIDSEDSNSRIGQVDLVHLGLILSKWAEII